jgi:CBS domain-containing membrane protein
MIALIALGVFTEPLQLLALFGGMVLLTIQAILVNRAAGLPYPLWAPHAAPNTQRPHRWPS